MLQVRVNQGNVIAAGMGKAGIQACLFTEIPGEGNYLHGALLGRVNLAQVMECCIPAAVVNKDDLVVITAAFKGTDDCFLKVGHILCFVIAGDDQR